MQNSQRAALFVLLSLIILKNSIAQTSTDNQEMDTTQVIPTQFYAYLPKLFNISYEGAFSHDRNFVTQRDLDIGAPLDWGHQVNVSALAPLKFRTYNN